jgi:hypothetical protein
VVGNIGDMDIVDVSSWRNLNFETSFPGFVAGIHLYETYGRENIMRTREILNNVYTNGKFIFISWFTFWTKIFFWSREIINITGILEVSI